MHESSILNLRIKLMELRKTVDMYWNQFILGQPHLEVVYRDHVKSLCIKQRFYVGGRIVDWIIHEN